jgi:hypothetical protein
MSLRKVVRFVVPAFALTFSLNAAAHITQFTGVLSEATEATHLSPPSAGTGSTTVTFDSDVFTMRVQASFGGLTGTTTASHIHCCTALPREGFVSVATTTPTFPGFPLGVTGGVYDQTFDMLQASSYNSPFLTANGGVPGNAFQALLDGALAGKAYLNIHTSAVSGGEIRAFLAPVPEPQTYALMLAGIGLVGWAARRRVPA